MGRYFDAKNRLENGVNTPLKSAMMRSPALFSLIASALLFASQVRAAHTYEYTLGPEDIGTGSSLLVVNPVPGGDTLPIAGATGPEGWGETSFITNIDGTNGKYTQLYINLQEAFQTAIPLTLGDIVGITYWTKQEVTNNNDWSLRLYSQKLPGQASGWYGHRFDATTPSPGNTDWNMWDADAAGWFKTVTSGGGGAADTTGYSLTELGAEYGSESLLYFSIFAGSSTNTGPIFNQLDGIVITLANGDQLRMDLIPEPGTIALGILGALSVIGHRIIRRKMTTP